MPGWRLIDVAPDLPQELGALLQLGPSVFDRISAALVTRANCETLPLSSLRLLPPAATAGKILCLGLNYLHHAAESKMDRPQDPVIFLRAASSLVGHGGAIVCPAISNTLDFEGELVAIIGKRARHVHRSAALEHLAGYSIFNDGSIREYQADIAMDRRKELRCNRCLWTHVRDRRRIARRRQGTAD